MACRMSHCLTFCALCCFLLKMAPGHNTGRVLGSLSVCQLECALQKTNKQEPCVSDKLCSARVLVLLALVQS